MKVIKNLNQILTLEKVKEKDGRNLLPEDLSIITDASIVYDSEEIVWVGKSEELPNKFESLPSTCGKGYVLTPGLIDSHTHLVFGGNRAFEYTMRLNGSDYQEIASAGGGILSTMKNTLRTTREELFQSAKKRIEQIFEYGIKAIEIKSGYALTFEKEKELTLIINDLKKEFKNKIEIHNTFLAAHAIPAEYASSSQYLNEVVLPLLKDKDILSAIDSVDIFHEEGYFSKDDVLTLFEACKTNNIKTRIHADEFNDNKGAVIASQYECLSADHLLCTTKDGIEALSKSSTVATVLPGTAFFLGKPLANAKELLNKGCKVAIASDYNPGSSHCDNLVLVASIAAKNMGFNIAQLWSAITFNAAASLDLKNTGYISEGARPILSAFKSESIDEITYNWGKNLNCNSLFL